MVATDRSTSDLELSMAATVQTQKARKDPRPRRSDGARRGAHLVGADPDMHYVLASPNGAADEYMAMGYEVVHASDGGVRFASRKPKAGEVITFMDQILLCISKSEKEEMDQYGADGESGWELADEIENRIIDKRGAQRDLMRGLNGAYTKLVAHDVSALEPLA